MSILKCPECNHDVNSEAPYCPNCGYPMKKKEETYIGPEPIDPMWIKKYKKKAIQVKCIQLYITIVILVLFTTSMILRNNSLVWNEIALFSGFLSLLFVILTILCFFAVRTKVFNIDGYNIVTYCGYVKNVLVIENVVIDSVIGSSFHNTDIFAKLPNGKPILARFTLGSASVCENRK